MEIRSLKNVEFDKLFIAFSEAFKDYEIQLNKKELFSMLERRAFVSKLSFGAFDNDKLVAFTFNGFGIFNKIKTAYDTGTGTIEGYRGKGLAGEIFEYSLPHLKKAGVENYLLEVLQNNTKAISVYKKLGFEVQREFNYFVQENIDIVKLGEAKSSDCVIKPIGLGLCEQHQSFLDFVPSWQNSFDSVRRRIDDFIILGAYTNKQLNGYCIFEINSGDITQIAVRKNARRNGIASILLNEVLKSNKSGIVKIINTELGIDSLDNFFKYHNIPLAGKQFEMIKKL